MEIDTMQAKAAFPLDDSSADFYEKIVGKKRKVESATAWYFCQVCQVRVHESRPRHEACTTHQLNLKLRSRCRRVLIPDGNKGAQLLAKMGWRDDGLCSGLGAREQGRVLPVATTLKRDRTGLGASSYTPRVTHTLAPSKRIASVSSRTGCSVSLCHEFLHDFRTDSDLLPTHHASFTVPSTLHTHSPPSPLSRGLHIYSRDQKYYHHQKRHKAS